MKADSLNQLMIDVLRCGDPRENVTQNVTLSKLTGTWRLIMVWTEVLLDGHTYLYGFTRGGISAARHRSDSLELIVRPQACANGDAIILMQDNAPAHTAQLSMTFM